MPQVSRALGVIGTKKAGKSINQKDKTRIWLGYSKTTFPNDPKATHSKGLS